MSADPIEHAQLFGGPLDGVGLQVEPGRPRVLVGKSAELSAEGLKVWQVDNRAHVLTAYERTEFCTGDGKRIYSIPGSTRKTEPAGQA